MRKKMHPGTMIVLICLLPGVPIARAVTNSFFTGSQTATLIASNINAVTIQSGDYQFTYSADGYWSSGGGTPTGRFFSILWPAGVQAQAITVGPLLGTGANITLKRADGKLFDLQAFTGKILLNTAGAGASFEIMPQLEGNDAFSNPLQYDCTGYAGQSFQYTTALAGYDTYQIHMWGDFALTALTLIDTNPPAPPGPTFTISASASPAGAGTAGGAGSYPSNSTCTLMASSNPGWGFQEWTENGARVSGSANYTFTVQTNRTLVANFRPGNISATFDFDTGSPPVGPGQGIPGTQTQNGVTATFSTLSGGWSVQNTFYLWKPAVFSGNFLYPSTLGSAFAVEFSEPVTNFSMAFFTGEVSSEYDTAGLVTVTAYTNLAMTSPVASGSARGMWVTGAYPEGTLSFGAATPFTKVRIEVPSQSPAPSYLVFVDNIIAQLAAPPLVTIDVGVEPAGAGTVTGSGTYLKGTSVTLSATASVGFNFARWSEGGELVASAADYTFDAVTNRVLVANFTTDLPPLALGGTFYQLAGQPLAINISDLMWSDYDPDGNPISFAGVSATTSNGLVTATNATQILLPANAAADAFSYTIADSQGATALGAAMISIITNVTSRGLWLDMLSSPGAVAAGFHGVPWYYYECQRATNITFTGTLATFPVQSWDDGSIYVFDDFGDLAAPPPQAFYRLRYVP
jgi:hypothetical protein